MALQAVIFDVDETLIDSNDTHIEAWREAFAVHGYDIAGRASDPRSATEGTILC